MQHLFEIWKQICESNTFNFVVMALVLVWIWKKCDLGNGIERGRKKVEDSVVNAEKTKDENLKELYEVQNSVVDVDERMLDILSKAEENAKSFGEKILSESEKLKEEIAKNSEKAIESNVESIKNEISKETAQEAVELAENHIKSELQRDSSLHYRYIDESLNALDSIDGVQV